MNHFRPIGVTQRQMLTPYGELRDCLAVDWYPFLRALGIPWLALPNDPAAALDMARRYDLCGLVVTGGDDIGVFPQRDATECVLLDFFREKALPTVGVCRGFQLICVHFGGNLKPVAPSLHRATRHVIQCIDGTRREVNSFHNLAPAVLPEFLTPLAHCVDDDCLEAAMGSGFLGILWHPEREKEPQADDLLLLKTHFEVIP